MAEFFLVDAFTSDAFSGNPAAVVVLDAPARDAWMQSVAAEMNQTETAFLVQEEDGWGLRWMTPAIEVDLCGHATLAAAHVLWEAGHEVRETSIHFHTKSGDLVAWAVAGEVEMDFPRTPVVPEDVPPDFAAALGAHIVAHGRNDRDRLVVLESEQAVRALVPDMPALAAAWPGGVIVTAEALDPRWDFVSRFFAPALGVPEDPVTGSAHCALGPWWAERLGKRELVGWQASRRGGVVRVSVTDERCFLRGAAVTVVRGELRV